MQQVDLSCSMACAHATYSVCLSSFGRSSVVRCGQMGIVWEGLRKICDNRVNIFMVRIIFSHSFRCDISCLRLILRPSQFRQCMWMGDEHGNWVRMIPNWTRKSFIRCQQKKSQVENIWSWFQLSTNVEDSTSTLTQSLVSFKVRVLYAAPVWLGVHLAEILHPRHIMWNILTSGLSTIECAIVYSSLEMAALWKLMTIRYQHQPTKSRVKNRKSCFPFGCSVAVVILIFSGG